MRSGNEPFFGKFLDLNMLVMLAGYERTEAEYQALFKAANFHLTIIYPTRTGISMIEGIQV